MIGRLTGTLLEKQPPHILLDISGVAYEVEASMQTFYQLPEIGNKVTLHTHFVVREDAQLLYGFFQLNERSLFRSLIKVNGVGPKLALAILSSMHPEEFVICVNNNDVKMMTRIPGVGKKTAERLIIEMRDRLQSLTDSDNSAGISGEIAVNMPLSGGKLPSEEAISALVALGYKPNEASRAVNQVKQPDLSSEELIRQALKNMMK